MNLLYTQVPAKLREFFTGIPNWGVPQRITQQELAALGYKSSNDRTILGVLKGINIVGADGRPNENWQRLRDRDQGPVVLAQLIRTGYSDLFSVYPNAQAISDSQLKNYFSSKSKAGERVVQMAVATFKALVSLASFDREVVVTAEFTDVPLQAGRQQALPPHIERTTRGMHLTININIDGDSNPETVKVIFEGLKNLEGR